MFLKNILLLSLLFSPLLASRDVQGAVDVIKYMFETKYAPLHFKEQTLGWNLNQSIRTLRGEIAFTQNPKWLLRKFFLQPCDYHTCVFFHSTGSAYLPFTVKKIGNALYVSWVSTSCPDLAMGDQILEWDGFPAIEVFNQFKLYEVCGPIELYSSDAMAEVHFTIRSGELGYSVPRGDVTLSILSNETLEKKEVVASWKTHNEYYPFKELIPSPKAAFELEEREPHNPFIHKLALTQVAATGKAEESRSFDLGSKRGFLPHFGPVIREFKKAPFFYYIYTTPQNHRVAFLRIGSFLLEREDLTHLKKALNYFEKNCDGLILDLSHNLGGYVLDMFSILSYLIDAPIQNYEQNEILTSDEVEMAVELKVQLEEILEDEQELLKFIKKESPYNPTPLLAEQFLNYAEFILTSWENGERITPLYPILGVDTIQPDPSCTYSKPLLILTDHLSLSCADFFPGILKEAGRAHIFGERTGGAGGTTAKHTSFPNPLGIKEMVFTSSLVYTPNGDWIENKGIEPNFHYSLTAEDLKFDFIDYVDYANEVIDMMIEEKSCAR